MADTTPHGPDSLSPSPEDETGLAGRAGASTGRVRFPLVRWVLAPRTTWQAHRLATEFGLGMDAGTAWVMARLGRHPEEHIYAMQHLNSVENGG